MSIDEALFVLGIGLAFGIFFGYILFKPNDKIVIEEVEESEMDDQNEHYVKLPNNETRKILIEEPLGLNHLISLDEVWYKVIEVEHKENGHTIFILNWARL